LALEGSELHAAAFSTTEEPVKIGIFNLLVRNSTNSIMKGKKVKHSLTGLEVPASFTHPGNVPGTHFCYVSATITPMKNSSDTIGHRTRDLLVCSAVPKPTAPPRASLNNN